MTEQGSPHSLHPFLAPDPTTYQVTLLTPPSGCLFTLKCHFFFFLSVQVVSWPEGHGGASGSVRSGWHDATAL
eukprot:1290086-Rhodomonas_salina.1